MQLNYAEIAALLPHGRGMCMISEVIAWSENSIHCVSERLADQTNPLCNQGSLNTVLLIEYAAQAAGVHAALLNSGTDNPRPAYIGAVNNMELLQPLVDNYLPLSIKAECLMNNGAGAIYDIVVQQQEQPLLRGRFILSQPQSQL